MNGDPLQAFQYGGFEVYEQTSSVISTQVEALPLTFGQESI